MSYTFRRIRRTIYSTPYTTRPMRYTLYTIHGVLELLLVVVPFHRHLGRGIRDLFFLLHQHGTEALVYIDYPREAAASRYNLRRIASGLPWFPPLNSDANCNSCISAGTGVGRGKALSIECLTSDFSRETNAVNLSTYCSLGTISNPSV